MAHEIDRISDELRRAQEGDAWHGPGARQVLEGVTAAEAAARPIAGAHTIWELVLHIAAWRGEARRRLEGAQPGQPPEGDWPPVSDTSEPAWRGALHALEQSSVALRTAAGAFPEAKLDQAVGPERDEAVGTVGSYALMLHGVAQHDAYHLGQISLLRRAQAR